MKQPLDILKQMKNALDDAYVSGVRNASRPWQGLTDEEISTLDVCYHHDNWRLIKEVEAKLKEKNGYA